MPSHALFPVHRRIHFQLPAGPALMPHPIIRPVTPERMAASRICPASSFFLTAFTVMAMEDFAARQRTLSGRKLQTSCFFISPRSVVITRRFQIYALSCDLRIRIKRIRMLMHCDQFSRTCRFAMIQGPSSETPSRFVPEKCLFSLCRNPLS